MNDKAERIFTELKNKFSMGIPAVDYHLHTNWTDGDHSVQEMYHQACKVGLKEILFSEHARKTSGKWFANFIDEVRNLPQNQCRAYVGVEARVVDYDGNIEIERNILSQCDLVIGSVHRFPGKDGEPSHFDGLLPNHVLEMEFRLAEVLLDNPEIDILGHPFGMLYSKFKITPPETLVRTLMEKAGSKKIAFEINSKYHPDPWRYIRLCCESSASISLGSDAHSMDEIGKIVTLLKARCME
jgi:histidinol phosphatase-like PHP family hydrolase